MMTKKGKLKRKSSLPPDVLARLQSPEYRKETSEDFKKIDEDVIEIRNCRRINPINLDELYSTTM